jgi:RHS repeat-associated protein
LLRNPDGSLVFGPSATRWVGTGRIIYDNKANPVKAYEPFFDSTPVYDNETDLVEWGVTAITRYDPLSRAYRIDNPDGTYRTVEFDAWRQVSSDENDTVPTSAWYAARVQDPPGSDGADAAAKAFACAGTPSLADLDTLGRTFRTVADNGTDGTYPTQVTLDIQGHVRATTDAFGAVGAVPGARGRTVLTQDYDIVGTEIHRISVDAGERWLLPDAAGQHLLGWDGLGRQISADYDALRRPTGLHVTLPGATSGRLAERVIYGETLTLASAQAKNLRGAVYQHCDEAGIATTVQRDFDGHVTTTTRQLLTDFSGDIDWSTSQPLDNDVFTTAKAYDALGRPISVTTPDGSVTSQVFNERSLLTAVTVAPPGAAAVGYVTSISYDAKGQRQNLVYNNGAATAYTYDPDTFRLVTLTTTRQTGAGPLQALTYVYDAVGNITRLHDAAQQTIFFNNQIVTPDADYTYDAIYRLTRAVGREHRGLAGQPQTTWNDSPRIDIPLPTDGQAMRPYVEEYGYDAVGNFQKVVHTGDNGNWTRAYTYDQPNNPPASNRLTSTTVGSVTDTYSYDADGNIIEMPHLTLMAWNWKDQLHATSQATFTTGPPPYATYYRYDASGQRVRKVSGAQGVIAQQRIYLDGYEVYREYSSGSMTLERQSLHVSDSQRMICLIETTVGVDRVDRYQLGNQLGSAILEVDDNAAVLTYEEYHPYGSTSYQTGTSKAEVSLKRYRYTGKERDEESGFSYHGARYCAPWLGRWTSCDPAGIVDGLSLYLYGRCNPCVLTDPSGRQSTGQPAEPSGNQGASLHYIPPQWREPYPLGQGGGWFERWMAYSYTSFYEEGDIAASVVTSPGDSVIHRVKQWGWAAANLIYTGGYTIERLLLQPIADINKWIDEKVGSGTSEATALYLALNPIGWAAELSYLSAYLGTLGTETSASTELLRMADLADIQGARLITKAEGSLYAAEEGASGDRLLWTSWQNYPKVTADGREYAQIGDRLYTQHAVDRMAPKGLGTPAGAPGPGRSISPNFIEDVLSNTQGVPVKGPAGEPRLSYTSGSVQVITENGIVITVITR